jgi:hypothetical protein
MSGANLDGHSYPRGGIHAFLKMQKRIDVLEARLKDLQEIVYQLYEIEQAVSDDGK